jgi:hypothetical protein
MAIGKADSTGKNRKHRGNTGTSCTETAGAGLP